MPPLGHPDSGSSFIWITWRNSWDWSYSSIKCRMCLLPIIQTKRPNVQRCWNSWNSRLILAPQDNLFVLLSEEPEPSIALISKANLIWWIILKKIKKIKRRSEEKGNRSKETTTYKRMALVLSPVWMWLYWCQQFPRSQFPSRFRQMLRLSFTSRISAIAP